MARKTEQQIMLQAWWVRFLIGVAFLLLAYAFASLAIDSGSWLEYIVTVVFVWFGIRDVLLGIRLIFSR